MHTLRIINRNGVIVDPNGYVYKCKGEDHSVFHYELKIAFNNPLDHRGFLMDHEYIDEAIQDYIKDNGIPSCEELSQSLIEVVTSLLNEEDMKYLGLKLNIKPVMPVPVEGAFFTQIVCRKKEYAGLILSL